MTAQNIIPFAFEDHLVRVYKPNGEPWFVGKDVCDVLDISNHNQALKRLDDDERGTCSIGTPAKGVVSSDPLSASGNEQTVVVVSEAGVFRLIFSSRKPEAERFKRWLAHEVLPALRKHGSYSLSGEKGVHNMDPLSEFPAGDEALGVHLAKLATLKECRMIHGTRAAARLWRRLGMPQVTDSVIEELDEGRRCLAHLLATPTIDEPRDKFEVSHYTLRHMIEVALNDNGDVQQGLKERFGLLAITGEHEGLFVPNSTMQAEALFRDTPWAKGRHMQALRKLPGWQPMLKSVGLQCRGTFIPMTVIEAMPIPVETGGNVVPLKS